MDLAKQSTRYKGNSSVQRREAINDAEKVLSQGSQESATRYAQALWEEERRQHFLRSCEQVGEGKNKASTHPFDLRQARTDKKPSQALLQALYTQTPLNAKDIAILYGVSGSTVRRWLDECGIPITRKRKIRIIRRKNFKRRKIIGGIPHKLCSGPSHDRPTWVPYSEFWRNAKPNHSADGIKSQCKLCESHRVGHPRMVEFQKIEFAVLELVNRLGINETSRRTNISLSSLWKYRHQRAKQVHRKTAEKLLSTLAEVRKNGSVRHVDSIKHGAILRGREEKIPSRHRDFYSKQADIETEQKRAHRRTNKDRL